ncbi:MAG TPA: HepT-like ribonuclease domain-containing protein [Tepidisphaeraceae bacterium]|jgi:uncharacterized protein with HEPN domain|nr:HepT-like ribonuclease domain-containing protein [Tepidisphaeraceae bacterium]
MITPQQRKLLEDMRVAADDIIIFTRGKALANYLADKQLRYSVERAFEIIGEALTQLAKIDTSLVQQITDYRKIVSFRNVLIHGYSTVNPSMTWDIVERKLPVLRTELDSLLS